MATPPHTTWRISSLWLTLVGIIPGITLLYLLSHSASQAAPQQQAFSCATVTQVSEPECAGLVALYEQTNGSTWLTKTDWLATNTPCSWYHITCTGNRITSLVLDNNRLNGPFPAELGNLTNLEVLRLWSNQLQGEIPPELSNLTNLRELDLSFNRLTGFLPAELGNLIHLEVLSLGSNQLQGDIPPEFGALTNLQGLYLYHNSLSGALPVAITNLTNLSVLSLHENHLSGPLPPELANLRNLSYLRLADNQFSGQIPAELGALPQGVIIDLPNNELSGPIPPAIFKLDLVGLDLRHNQLSGVLPSATGDWSKIQRLDLSNNQLQGEIPAILCDIRETDSLKYMDLSHNRLYTSDPAIRTCLNELNPGWDTTQTLPPTDIQATALSSDTVQLTWTPISYTQDGGYYAIVASPVVTPSAQITQTTTGKDVSSYEFTGLSPDVDYAFTIRTYTQLLDLWSESSAVVMATPRSTFVTVVDEEGQPLPGITVIQYNGNTPKESRSSDEAGHVFFDQPRVGDTLAALALQHTQPSGKQFHDDWSYRIYTTNMDIGTNGEVAVHEIKQAGEQVLTVKKRNPLVLYNLLVSVEWITYRVEDQNPELQDDTFLQQLSRGLRSASNVLYDATDGQFAFGNITIYDGGRHWDDADMQILVSNQVHPHSTVGGITAAKTFTYTSSTDQISIYHPGFFRMGRVWNHFAGITGPLDKPEAFRTLAHEFAHYALYLYDEYFYLKDDGTVQIDDVYCTSPDIRTSLEDPSSTNASIMDWHYNASELAWQGPNTSLWSENCKNTQQWAVHQESDWETVTRIYTDSAEPARWRFVTPADRNGDPNPGPGSMPLDFPRIIVVGPDNPADIVTKRDEFGLDVKNSDGEFLPPQSVQVYLFRQKEGQAARIFAQGTPDSSGKMELVGAQIGDVLKAINWNGDHYISSKLTTSLPLELQPARWNPAVDAYPRVEEDESGLQSYLKVEVSPFSTVMQSLEVTLVSLSDSFSQTISLTPSPSKPGVYTNEFHFTNGRFLREGHLWIRGLSADGEELETITTYAIGGAPGSHFRAYTPLDPASNDGNLQLHIPDGGIADNTFVIVLPTRGIQRLPENVSSVGTPYTMRASGNITHLADYASLTMFYSQEAVKDKKPEQLCVFYWNEETGIWESPDDNKDKVVNEAGHFISIPVDRLGIYAIVADETGNDCIRQTHETYLPLTLNAH